jgi:SARP family transcriptional regulator, regulator of embCAB operon
VAERGVGDKARRASDNVRFIEPKIQDDVMRVKAGTEREAPPRDSERSRASAHNARLALLGRFRFSQAGCELRISRNSQRLLVMLALNPGGVDRDLLAGVLWPMVSDRCAHTCLRSALARLRQAASFAVHSDELVVSLQDDLAIDLHEGQRIAHRILQMHPEHNVDALAQHVAMLSVDLLPGWYEDWTLAEAETWRQLRLHALEALADMLREEGRFAHACLAASAAIAGDPLRETARASLIQVHIAEGNLAEAWREGQQFRLRLKRELGVEPSPRLEALLPDFAA